MTQNGHHIAIVVASVNPRNAAGWRVNGERVTPIPARSFPAVDAGAATALFFSRFRALHSSAPLPLSPCDNLDVGCARVGIGETGNACGNCAVGTVEYCRASKCERGGKVDEEGKKKCEGSAAAPGGWGKEFG